MYCKVSCYFLLICFLFVFVFLIRYVIILFYFNDVEEGGEIVFFMVDNVIFSMEVRFLWGVSF